MRSHSDSEPIYSSDTQRGPCFESLQKTIPYYLCHHSLKKSCSETITKMYLGIDLSEKTFLSVSFCHAAHATAGVGTFWDCTMQAAMLVRWAPTIGALGAAVGGWILHRKVLRDDYDDDDDYSEEEEDYYHDNTSGVGASRGFWDEIQSKPWAFSILTKFGQSSGEPGWDRRSNYRC